MKLKSKNKLYKKKEREKTIGGGAVFGQLVTWVTCNAIPLVVEECANNWLPMSPLSDFGCQQWDF